MQKSSDTPLSRYFVVLFYFNVFRELEAASLESENEIRHASEQVFMAKENSKQKKRRGEVPLSAY